MKKREYSLESPETGQIASHSPAPRVTVNTPKSIEADGNPTKEGQKRTFRQLLTSKCFLGIVIFCVLCITFLCIGLVQRYEKDNDVTLTVDAYNDKLSPEQLFWFDSALDELRQALRVGQNSRRAKNVILFVADGMGPSTVTAARIYKEKEEGHLIWERFPHMGLLKVSSNEANNYRGIFTT